MKYPTINTKHQQRQPLTVANRILAIDNELQVNFWDGRQLVAHVGNIQLSHSLFQVDWLC